MPLSDPVHDRRAAANDAVTTPVIAGKNDPDDWAAETRSGWREYAEVVAVIGAVTWVNGLLPLTYHTLGLVYLLVVILLSLRVGRWPVLVAAVLSAAVWVFVYMPPRFSFEVLESSDGLLLGTYVVVALVAGELTSRLRAQERLERLRERRATALFHLIRAIAEAGTFDEGVRASLRQIDRLFGARTAILLPEQEGGLKPYGHASLSLTPRELLAAEWTVDHRAPGGRFSVQDAELTVSFLPLLHAGRVHGVLAIQLEMPDLPEAQRSVIEAFATQLALLVAREELRETLERERLFAESDRLRRTLLDSVSHELKTPIAVLRSAGDKLDLADEVKRAQLSAEIRTATRRLEHLVANLLNQTRLESGALKPQLDWCDVRDLVTAARRGLGDQLEGRAFTMEIPPDMPLVRADAPLMEQVLGNLLGNACLYTPAGSPVRFSSGVEERAEGRRIFMRVDDCGPGIPDEMKSRLFGKFQRGQSRPGGLGLGLAIARGFMRAQGGEIMVENNPGGGARFVVYLPYIPYDAVPNDER